MKKLAMVILTLAAIGVPVALPPLKQNPHYHDFANQVAHWGIPNFWNVISNVCFLFVAIAAALELPSQKSFRKPWQRTCFRVLILGIALTAFGSAYYHWRPSDARLMWDRLPMTIVFMCVLTMIFGEQIEARWRNALLWSLLVLGVGSVIFWRVTGDLRPYALVQFYPLVAVPVMLLLFPRKYPAAPAYWAMMAFYALAKLAELFDGSLPCGFPGGGHAWKHILAAIGLFVFTRAHNGKTLAVAPPTVPFETLAVLP